MSTDALPRADDPNVFLAIANVEELKQQWNSNSAEWKGPFDLETYLRREQLLVNQELTKNGGLVPWLLVYQPDANGPRRILCGCETISKKAIVVKNGQTRDVLCNGVASVFCSNDYRGQGYAGRMMSELAKKLGNWEFTQTDEQPANVLFSVLYSDIGKKFYAARGWENFASAHVSLKPAAQTDGTNSVRMLQQGDVAALAQDAVSILRRRMSSINNDRTTVAIHPDARTIEWLQTRARFFAKELFKKDVVNVGAITETAGLGRAWCFWQHNWTEAVPDKDNKLYILHIVVENEAGQDLTPAAEDELSEQPTPTVEAVATLLRAAQKEAADWGLSSVEFWNPTSLQLAAARLVDPNVKVEHREKSSIAALQWYGEGSWEQVDWVANERYGWN